MVQGAILAFGSSGRTRTYNPSVNSRKAYSRLALQTQDLHARKADCRINWGDSGGTLQRSFRSQFPTSPFNLARSPNAPRGPLQTNVVHTR